MNRLLSHRWAKPLVFALCLLPLSWLLYQVVQDLLGANPQEALIRATGDWALRFLVIVLAVTPLRELSGLSALARYRRMLGVFMYFYALLHFLSYSGFDMGFDVADIFNDIVKRPFILVGSLALQLLTPLAATSFNAAIRAVGAQRWQRMHRLVYAVAGLAILHFFWMRAGKNDFAEVAVYAGILALLLGWRLRKLRPRPR
ncbi:MAG: sulfoxide reductase heme-binding subunit YedZ [Rhodoferax sp.]|nr:sulfoxide reductase heme-binding subunit YedZ [Rhodoferax sp.]